MTTKKIVSIARSHIMAAIESAPCELEYPRYKLISSLYRPAKGGGCKGVRVVWEIKYAREFALYGRSSNDGRNFQDLPSTSG